jgi:outer membrane protein assembly factor BamB
MARTLTALILTLATGFSAYVAAQRPSTDWTQWRGPARDGAIVGFTEPKAWPEMLAQKWKVEVGLGYATPLVVGNRVYQFSRIGDNETMSAIDADTGKILWQTGYPVSFTMQSATVQHGPGPKSTPVFSNGRLYAIGMTAVITAFDAATGKQLWQKPGSASQPTFTTHSFSPLIEQGMVIFHPGGDQEGAIQAYDANTGAVKWSWKGDPPGYGSPILATLGGTRQVITITKGKVVGLDVASGALLWERPFVSTNATNAITPVLYDQTIIVSGNGGPTTAFTVAKQGTQWTTMTVWENADSPLRFSNGVITSDAFLSMTTRNSGQYIAVDAKTGKTLWTSEGRQATNTSLQKAGTLVFSLEDDGELVVLRSSRTDFEPVKRYKLAEAATWTQPVISGNRLFIKDVSSLALFTIN